MSGQRIDRGAVVEELLRRPSPPSLETLFGIVKQWGCRVTNLFHRMDGQWGANLRNREATEFFKFAYGPTAADALIGALQKVARAEYADRPPGDDEREARTVGSTKASEAPAPAEPEVDLFG